jgi:hypothetical protein
MNERLRYRRYRLFQGDFVGIPASRSAEWKGRFANRPGWLVRAEHQRCVVEIVDRYEANAGARLNQRIALPSSLS